MIKFNLLTLQGVSKTLMRKKIILFVLASIYFSGLIRAQSARQIASHWNGWFMYFGNHKVTNKLGVHLEAQWRRNQFIVNPQQLLLRTGVNYYLNKDAFVTAGYCFVETYPYGNMPVGTTFPEHRLWEQLQIKSQQGKVEWISRFRLEQRNSFLPIIQNNKYTTGLGVYTNRFRLMNRISIPLKGEKINEKVFYFTLYDEWFINFGKNVGFNIFDQNRAYVAFGYALSNSTRIELGYLNQLIVKSDGVKIENNHTLQLGLFSSCNIEGLFNR